MGIRDLTALPDGSLLVLSGPAQEQAEVPFGLFLLTKDKVTPLGWLRMAASVRPRCSHQAKNRPHARA